MKTFKVAFVALSVFGTAALSLAGPGPQYWRSRAQSAKPPAPASPASTAQASGPACACRAACHG